MDESRTAGLARDAHGTMCVNGVAVDELLRRAGVGTPAYVYDLVGVDRSARSIVEALGDRGLCCYAIKANAAPPVVKTLRAAGCGIDAVSGGEVQLAIACGVAPASIVYSGVAKRDDEIDLAIARGIKAIHAESVEEVERIAARARALGKEARVALRVNPAVEADVHAHIATGHDEAKFGIAREDLPRALAVARGPVRLVGLSSHVGSMLMTTEPYVASARVLCALARDVRAQGFAIEYLDCGGGYAVPYRDDARPEPGSAFVRAARAAMDEAGLADLALLVEPGRALVAAHGVLVATVIQPKRSSAGRKWLLIDAGMNDLIRPALYQAHHRIVPLVADADARDSQWRVCGPVCESSDDFGEYVLPDPPPSMVVVREAGAYGRSMASTYNARPIGSEVFVGEGGAIVAVRPAQTLEAYVAEQMI